MTKIKPAFYIGERPVGVDHDVYIIAEAGVNHNGDLNEAIALIDVAVEAGADAVKFQNFKADKLILQSVDRAVYQSRNTGSSDSQYSMLKALELSFEQNKQLKMYALSRGIQFLSTAFDEEGLRELAELDLPAYKISSTDTTNPWLIRKFCDTNKPLILSTGMSYLPEIDIVVDLIKKRGNPLCVMQCSTDYPLSDSDVNLRVISEFGARYAVPIGFSDHSIGLAGAVAAVALGACVIEKHFTLDRSAPGPDHSASLEPAELKELVISLRRTNKMLGDGVKLPSFNELQNRKAMQKSVVANGPIRKGEMLSENNLKTMRTGGGGIPALYIETFYGHFAERDYCENESI